MSENRDRDESKAAREREARILEDKRIDVFLEAYNIIDKKINVVLI